MSGARVRRRKWFWLGVASSFANSAELVNAAMTSLSSSGPDSGRSPG
jgi:hypothetical protein